MVAISQVTELSIRPDGKRCRKPRRRLGEGTEVAVTLNLGSASALPSASQVSQSAIRRRLCSKRCEVP